MRFISWQPIYEYSQGGEDGITVIYTLASRAFCTTGIDGGEGLLQRFSFSRLRSREP